MSTPCVLSEAGLSDFLQELHRIERVKRIVSRLSIDDRLQCGDDRGLLRRGPQNFLDPGQKSLFNVNECFRHDHPRISDLCHRDISDR